MTKTPSTTTELQKDVYTGPLDVTWNKIWPDKMPIILRDLAPINPFDPRKLWPEITEETPKNSVPKAKSKSKPKKADLIRSQVNKDKEAKQLKLDEEKLGNLKNVTMKQLLRLKMGTVSGRLKQLYEILALSVKSKQFIDAVDTLWEIQAMTQSVAPLVPVPAPTATSSKKNKPIKSDVDTELQNELYTIHRKYRNYTKLVIQYLTPKQTVEFQLTEMSDRLPPLNMHYMNQFILDNWQKDILRHIDNHHSVIVCAPTSSGKTVLSSYVTAIQSSGILFLVPTEPLAWQVAALFQHTKKVVGLITDGTVCLPVSYSIIVGTPRAVESQLLDIGYDFKYAIYDEVHDLNGVEGDALERIIKAISCPFLALSATIGNAQDLMQWWKKHHQEPEKIHLLEYKGRFINLQRMVWVQEEKKMMTLHPCAGLTLQSIIEEGLISKDLAFTPRDTFALWKAMQSNFAEDLIGDIDPTTYFSHTPNKVTEVKIKKSKDKTSNTPTPIDLGDTVRRITLLESKEYSDLVQQKLQSLAPKFPEITQKVLDSFSDPVITQLSKDDSYKNIESSLHSLVLNLIEKNATPIIAFQLDSVRCRQLQDLLLSAVEEAEHKMYPNYRKEILAEFKAWEKQQALLKKREDRKKEKEKEEDMRETQEFENGGAPDIYAPHPDFILTPVGHRLSSVEYADILHDLRWVMESNHRLLAGLRRGIGIYIRNLPAGYLRVIQTLAQAKRLAVVFSDDSLAFGVNMPFRTCCFCEDAPNGELTSLMAQQMAGRAGRRGLDREGNVVFAGMKWERIQELVRGQLPNVVGRETLYPVMALQKVVSRNMRSEIIQRLVAWPLREFMIGGKTIAGTRNSSEYLTISTECLKHFGVLNASMECLVDKKVATLIWEYRDDCAEALAMYWILEFIHKHFHNANGANINVQLALFNILLRVFGRQRYDPKHSSCEITVLQGSEDQWDAMTEMLKEYDAKVQAMDSPIIRDAVRLPVPIDEPLDGAVWETLVNNQIALDLETVKVHHLKTRLLHLGSRMMVMHNILLECDRYKPLEEITRKCFRRVKWIMIDSTV